jgi:hypothetical protein
MPEVALDQVRAKLWRVVLLSLIGVASLNLWTGGPLFALWVGSQTQGSGPLTMTALVVVVVVLLGLSLALVRLIAVLQQAYNKQTGQVPGVRAHTPWLRSMRGERPTYPGETPHVTAAERIMVLVVIAAVVVFEFWFFFLSGSPFDQRSGRSALPPPTMTQIADHGSITCSGLGCSSAGAAL